jgi:HTH-type transcriptional regulator, sugar sensing transcriptional regulator
MDKEIFREIGLTEGEIRVYTALIKEGKSSTGPLMKSSGISSSKIYLILEKLIQKGMVSFILENNVKKFHATNPAQITKHIEDKQEQLEKTKQKSEKLVSQLLSLNREEEESAQIYKGLRGMRAAYLNIIEELSKGDDFLFFSVSSEELTPKVKLFFENIHTKRIEKGINVKGIVDEKWKDAYKKHFKKTKSYDLKFLKLNTPSGVVIGKNRILMTLWDENPIAFEITSKRTSKRYQDFFYSLWKQAKP